MKTLTEIYKYRQMIFSLVRKELRGRYKGSVLGFLWTFINPLMQLIIYTVVFSVIMKSSIDNFYLFLFVGLIPWIFFATSLTGGAGCILSQKDMVNKIYFPREVLPIAYVTSSFVNMLYTFIVFFAVLFLSGYGVNGQALIFLPIVMLTEYVFALAIGLLASGVTVYFRDMEHLLGILSMAWMYLSPIFFPMELIPDTVRSIYLANPMTPIIEAYHAILYYKHMPQGNGLYITLGISLFLLLISFYLFGKLKRRFSEEM